MAVRIVTDSTADLPEELVARHAITVVPLTVFFGEDAYLDGTEMDAATFYARMRGFSGLPRTSQPSVQRFKAVYDDLVATGHQVVSIHISSRMSGTLNSATLARDQLGSDARVELVDSRNVSLGLGAVVLEAAEAAEAGADREAVAEVARAAISRVQVTAVVETLEYLRRGGRIGRARSLLGSLLKVKPILRVEDGELAPVERVRTRAKAIERLVEVASEDRTLKRLWIGAADDAAVVAELRALLAPLLPDTEIISGGIGAVVGAHGGPGVFGICTVKRE